MKVVDVPVCECVSRGNVRHVVVDAELRELAARMQQFGQERPIDVYLDNQTYVVLHRHRRLMAAQLNAWETIQAIVRQAPKSEDEGLLRQYFDNETAVRLSFLEKARVYLALKNMGWSQQEIAAQFKISSTTVSQALSSLKAHPKLQDAIDRGRISPSAVEPLLSLSLDEQAQLADAAILRKTAAGVTDLVKTYKSYQTFTDTHKEVEDVITQDDADPLEELAVQDLQDALDMVQKVSEQGGVQHPLLRRQARLTVRQLVQTAQALDSLLQE